MHRRYVVADVFTGKPFTGNPLAVFREADVGSKLDLRSS